MEIKPYQPADFGSVLRIINDAAEAYRGVIPDDRWHVPYMGPDELSAEIDAGVSFQLCCSMAGEIIGVMGAQPVQDVLLIRHAYVDPTHQREGVGRVLIENLMAGARRPVLVGTWKAASWAIKFYKKHGFRVLDNQQTRSLLIKYWNIPDRQIETSVVLADPAWFAVQP